MCSASNKDFNPCEYCRDSSQLCHLTHSLLTGDYVSLDQADRRWLVCGMFGVESERQLDDALPRLTTAMRGSSEPPLASISRNFRRHPAQYGLRFTAERWLPVAESRFAESLSSGPLLSLGELLQLHCLSSRSDEYFGLWVQDAAAAYGISPVSLGRAFTAMGTEQWCEQVPVAQAV